MEVTVERLRSNIPKLNLLSFFTMFLIIMPIIVPFWQSLGLTMKDVYTLQAVFGFVLILFDLPAGYISDLIGRKPCLLLVGLFNGSAYTVFAMSDTFAGFVVFEILAGIGLSLLSGCDVALLYDTLDALKERGGQESTFLGRRLFFNNLGETIASLLGGFLAFQSLHLPVYVHAVTAWIPLFIAMSLVEPPRAKLSRSKHKENFALILKSLFSSSKLLTTLIIFNIIYGFATYIAVWSYQPHWTALGIPVEAFGYLWAILNLFIAMIAKYAAWIEKTIGSVTLVLIIAISPIIANFGLAFSQAQWAVGFILLLSLCRGLNGVIVVDAITSRVPKEIRATANSVTGLGMRCIFFFIGPFMGSYIDRNGTFDAFHQVGIAYCIVFFLLALPLIAQRKKFRKILP